VQDLAPAHNPPALRLLAACRQLYPKLPETVVFSGRYAEHGDKVAAHLLPRIERALALPPGSLPWRICRRPPEDIVAEAGMSALLASRHQQVAS
jgi:hypothetical protein